MTGFRMESNSQIKKLRGHIIIQPVRSIAYRNSPEAIKKHANKTFQSLIRQTLVNRNVNQNLRQNFPSICWLAFSPLLSGLNCMIVMEWTHERISTKYRRLTSFQEMPEKFTSRPWVNLVVFPKNSSNSITSLTRKKITWKKLSKRRQISCYL